MFCCESCQYRSDRKYNIQKHIKNVHIRDASDAELTNTQILSKNDKQIFSTCKKCLKNFKTFHGCKKHETSCKGVSNALECHHCHMVLATASSKCKHVR